MLSAATVDKSESDYPDVAGRIFKAERVREAVRTSVEDDYNKLLEDRAGMKASVSLAN